MAVSTPPSRPIATGCAARQTTPRCSTAWRICRPAYGGGDPQQRAYKKAPRTASIVDTEPSCVFSDPSARHSRRDLGKDIDVRILVTGGAGFIGSHVVDRLLQDRHEVVVIDDLSSGRRDNVNRAAHLHVADLRDPELEHVVAEIRPAAVVHLAAQTAVSRSVADPTFDASVNILGMLNLLNACHATRVRDVAYISTEGAAYGDTDVIPTPETHLTRPTSPYGVSKVAAELYLDCWAALHGGRGVSLRLANVYGPRQNPEGEAGVVAIFAMRLLGGRPCVINGDGLQTRDFVYVSDVADAVVRAVANSTAVGPINVGTAR
jgi:UDP-glucose 4-epimerase